ncbi:UDP-glucose/GDP-mannose dehydrogenase family protein [Paenibacillus xylanexedens]|uniref:nucleotide sugar dehydrogenase n=1 Tax=Paenibacillus sp. FSL R7-0272 TaxID=2921679 RepID=UPI0012B8928D|nr:UDP-glucose/GDP-mannose dehydrogenase family protein [Paenibacillus xylanexedens]
MKMVKISIIGTGYVGLVTGSCFASYGNEVICADVDSDRIKNLSKGVLPFYEPGLSELCLKHSNDGTLTFTSDIKYAIEQSDIVFITVGTPTNNYGQMDLSYVYEAVDNIGEYLNQQKIIVVKSTIPAGTTRKLITYLEKKYGLILGVNYKMFSNPEFLRQGTAVYDCLNPERIVIGSNDLSQENELVDVYQSFSDKIINTSYESSEMIKNTANAFLAMKISFINDIASICEQVGADVVHVAEGIGSDQRIGKHFLKAGVGYGGSCFPKDTEDLCTLAGKNNHDFKLLKAVIETNDRQPLLLINKMLQTFGELKGKQITILGLSFKPDTSDIRNAPSIKLIEQLLLLDADINVFDPVALNSIKGIFDERIKYYSNHYDAVANSDACIIITEWNEIVESDINTLVENMKHPIIFDGRNCLNYEYMKTVDIQYHCMGRNSIYNYKLETESIETVKL